MKSLGTLSVVAHLPGPIARLSELAYNLWWIWNPHAQALYSDMDAALWDSVSHNPVKFLRRVSQTAMANCSGGTWRPKTGFGMIAATRPKASSDAAAQSTA